MSDDTALFIVTLITLIVGGIAGARSRRVS
jgi:hypothetical protein